MIYPVISDMHVPEKFNVSLHLAYLKGFVPLTDWRQELPLVLSKP